MDIIKRLFCFNDDEESAIGLCKFNDDFIKACEAKEHMKKRLNKEANLTQMLKRGYQN